jgi:hypothetical protein
MPGRPGIWRIDDDHIYFFIIGRLMAKAGTEMEPGFF